MKDFTLNDLMMIYRIGAKLIVHGYGNYPIEISNGDYIGKELRNSKVIFFNPTKKGTIDVYLYSEGE